MLEFNKMYEINKEIDLGYDGSFEATGVKVLNNSSFEIVGKSIDYNQVENCDDSIFVEVNKEELQNAMLSNNIENVINLEWLNFCL